MPLTKKGLNALVPEVMKVLIDHPMPFSLAHGGLQVQIEQTKKALEEEGINVEWLRWWDTGQGGDIIHYFGAAPVSYQNFARIRGIPVLQTILLSETCNRSSLHLFLQGAVTRALLASPLGGRIKAMSGWGSIINAHGIAVTLEAEKMVLSRVYGYPEEQVHIVPIGCEAAFQNLPPGSRTGDYLICTGTITGIKRNVELARMAHAAQVPILFVGQSYGGSNDSYWQEFSALAQSSPYVRHHPHTDNREQLIELLRGARGFILYSKYENWCIAADEATACGLPVLLADQRWSRERFPDARYWLIENNDAQNVATIKAFYEAAPTLPLQPLPPPWREVARRLAGIYRAMIAKAAR